MFHRDYQFHLLKHAVGCVVLVYVHCYILFLLLAFDLQAELFSVQWDVVGCELFVWVVVDRLKRLVGYIQFLLLAYVLQVELFGVQWDIVGCVEFDLVACNMLMVLVGCKVMQEVGCVLEP